MKHAITPVDIFPASATQLRVASGWTQTLGQPPRFHYYLEDDAGSILKEDDCSMTQEQWDDWRDQVSDAEYILGAIAYNLGLTLAA